METLAYFIIAVADVYMIHSFFSNQFAFRWQSAWKTLIGYLCLLMVQFIPSLFFSTVFVGILSVVLTWPVLLLLYEGSPALKALLLAAVYFLGGIAEFLVCIEYELLTKRQWETGLSGGTTEWFMMAIQVVLVKICIANICLSFGKKRRWYAKGKENLLLIWFPLLSCFYASELLIVFRSCKEALRIHIIIGLLLIILLNMLVFYVLRRMSNLLYEQKEKEMLLQKNQLEQEYYMHLNDIEQRQRIYLHDMKHYLEMLKSYTKAGSDCETGMIFEQIRQSAQKLEEQIYPGSGLLNALLMAKVEQAKKYGVTMELEIEPSVNLSFLKEIDMIAMFGNLIDNAICGAASCKNNRFVLVRLFETEGNFILFTVENDYEGALIKKGHKYISTKKEEGHGMGIASVSETAAAYGGILNIQDNAGHFKAVLSLSKACK